MLLRIGRQEGHRRRPVIPRACRVARARCGLGVGRELFQLL
jgi:hypothetical protein